MGLVWFSIGVVVGALLRVILPLVIALWARRWRSGLIALPLILAVLILAGIAAAAPPLGHGLLRRRAGRLVGERPQSGGCRRDELTGLSATRVKPVGCGFRGGDEVPQRRQCAADAAWGARLLLARRRRQ